MKVALIQLDCPDGEPIAERTERVAELIRAQAGADLVMLPELWTVGAFDFRRWEESAESLDGPIATAMADAAGDAEVVLHAGSLIERSDQPGPDGRHLWNTALMFDRDGSRVTLYRKMRRFIGGKEPHLIEAGQEFAAVEVTSRAGESLRAGLLTCYDLRFPELFGTLLKAEVGMYLLPAGWPMARLAHWRTLVTARAIENQAFVLACDTAGTHAKHQMAGHSMIVGPSGEVLAEAAEREEVLRAEINLADVEELRASFPVLRDRVL